MSIYTKLYPIHPTGRMTLIDLSVVEVTMTCRKIPINQSTTDFFKYSGTQTSTVFNLCNFVISFPVQVLRALSLVHVW